MDFKNINIKSELIEKLTLQGITSPTEIQELSIPAILAGNDVIGEAQTGTGKTLSFLLPIFQNIDKKDNNIQALILAPTRELAIQITSEANKLCTGEDDINILSLYGGKDMISQIKKLSRNIHIVIATPGRLIDHLKSGNISLKSLKTFVLDEADQMLFMGFRNEIDLIMKDVPKKAQHIFFSATMDAKVKKLSYRYMKDPKIISIEKEEVTLTNIKQEIANTSDRWKKATLYALLKEDNPFMAIIFCRTKRRVDELYDYMCLKKFNCVKLHSDIQQSKRERIMKSFRSGDIQYLIATDVAARGIDISSIDYIYNYDSPETPESYIHRIGRTGRKGATGYTCMLIAPKDMGHLKAIEETIKMKIDTREVEIVKE